MITFLQRYKIGKTSETPSVRRYNKTQSILEIGSGVL